MHMLIKNNFKFNFKVIIVTIRPNTELLLSNNITSSRPCLPLLSWQFVIIQFNKTSNSSHRIMDPVLAFTRDDTVYFYQVTFLNVISKCLRNKYFDSIILGQY